MSFVLSTSVRRTNGIGSHARCWRNGVFVPRENRPGCARRFPGGTILAAGYCRRKYATILVHYRDQWGRFVKIGKMAYRTVLLSSEGPGSVTHTYVHTVPAKRSHCSRSVSRNLMRMISKAVTAVHGVHGTRALFWSDLCVHYASRPSELRPRHRKSPERGGNRGNQSVTAAALRRREGFYEDLCGRTIERH